jgi:hypothetical protein
VEANKCRVLSLSYPGVLDVWRQRLSSYSGIDDLPLMTTPLVQQVSLVPLVNEIFIFIHQNILDTGFPKAVTVVSTSRVKPRQECFKLVTTFNLLYQSIDNDFLHLNLFVHNTGEIYPNLGTIQHIHKYRSRETRMRQTKAILRWCAENEPQLMALTGKTTCRLKMTTTTRCV